MADSAVPLTLCHACNTVLAHAGQDRFTVAADHALDAHRDALTGHGPAPAFTDLGRDPGILLGRPRTITG